MKTQKLIVNIFSNWTNLGITILLAFFVSPIIVHQLGNELYGIWALVVSITGYFTILDFGVNTAVLRFISKYVAQQDARKVNEVYNTAFVFFLLISLVILVSVAVLAGFFREMFHITALSSTYIYGVCLLAGIDVACSLLFSVLSASLKALQEFLKLNIIEILFKLIHNSILVYLLFQGYKLLALASLHLSLNLIRYGIQYLILHRKYPVFRFNRSLCSKAMLKQIYSYSVYSFMIAIAAKILFFTDSIVIGARLVVNVIPYYTIPATLIEYVQRFILAIIAVLIPLISSHEAVGDMKKNTTLYLIGTRYILILSCPVLFVLFTVGGDFIGLWMGAEYGIRSQWVLRILLSGYVFSFPQLLASGMLEGISRHKFLAYVLLVEAFANLGISVFLAPRFGVEGVAAGTALPLIIVNLCVLPFYTCKLLHISVLRYFLSSYLKPFSVFLLFGGLYTLFPVSVSSYPQLVLYSGCVVVVWGSIAVPVMLEKAHRRWILEKGREWMRV